MGANLLSWATKLMAANKRQKQTEVIEIDSGEEDSEDGDSSDDSSDEDSSDELHKAFLAYSFEVQPAIARGEVVVIK